MGPARMIVESLTPRPGIREQHRSSSTFRACASGFRYHPPHADIGAPYRPSATHRLNPRRCPYGSELDQQLADARKRATAPKAQKGGLTSIGGSGVALPPLNYPTNSDGKNASIVAAFFIDSATGKNAVVSN